MMAQQESLPGVPARRGRRSIADIERTWYDRFCSWPRDDRAAALKVLTILHEQLPAAPAKGTEE